MQTVLFISLCEDSKTSLYMLPFGCADLPLGAHIPVVGETVSFAVFKPQAKREILEPRNFEVVERSTYLQCDYESGAPYRAEVTLVLRDRGSAMRNEKGDGALGKADPVSRSQG